MTNALLLPDLRVMLAENDPSEIACLFELHPATVAEFLEGLTVDEIWRFLDQAPVAVQAAVFSFFPHDKQAELVEGGGGERAARLVEAMYPDDRVTLLRKLPKDVADGILAAVDEGRRSDSLRLMTYPIRSAGAIMTTAFAVLEPRLTVAEAMTSLRQQAAKVETIYYCYVLDADHKPIGFTSVRDLILAEPTKKVADVMRREIVSVDVHMDQEKVARLMARYDFLAIPVVDRDGRMLGIVTHDDVLDVLVEEQTEDVQRMAGVIPMEEDYMTLPFVTVWRRRTAWLSCLFLAELFTFSALAGYEDAVKQIVALSLFVPLCISTGGNSGSQAATLITRAMALGQIRPGEWFRVIRHELAIGIALGLTLGAIGFVRASLTPRSVLGDANRWLMAWVIAQAVAGICLWGTIVGSMLPLVFRKLGFDPAYASSPFVATFVDVTGIVIYFSIASVYLF